MRHIISILIAAIALVGCHAPSTVHTQTAAPMVATALPFHPMLITTLGTYPSLDGSWRIEVSEDSITLARPAARVAAGDGVGFIPQSQGWRVQAGWFVFTESESRAWVYDGGSRLYLAAFYPSAGAMYYGIFRATDFDSNFPCAVPPEVISHLPEPKQQQLKHGSTTLKVESPELASDPNEAQGVFIGYTWMYPN